MAMTGYQLQYFARWLNNFKASGPLPIHSTFDQGFEAEVSKFIVPKRWRCMDAHLSYSVNLLTHMNMRPAFEWYFVNNHRVWLVSRGPSNREVLGYIRYHSVPIRI